MFLLFPDSFERMVTTKHKREVAAAFRDEPDEVPDFAHMRLVDLDRELLAIRERLQAEYPSEEIDFYESPLKEHWRLGSASASPTEDDDDRADDEDDESWYRQRFGESEVWAIAPGRASGRNFGNNASRQLDTTRPTSEISATTIPDRIFTER